jgi:8-amino-7-oxononanoate synthase
VFTTGHQANLGALGTILGPSDTVIVDSGDHASILDGVLLSRAKLRPFRHNRLDKLERALEPRPGRRRRRAGRGRRRLLDGGRRRAAAEIAELCERFGARLMVDEAHAPACWERAAPARGAARRRGPRRSADGHLLQVARLLRRLRSPDRPR